jgi:hypothetical protein
VLNLERAIMVRHWSRDRTMDERVVPAFEYDENWINPEIGTRMALDRGQFSRVMDEYYQLRGWDPRSGWPTRAKLQELGMGAMYEAMTQGAEAARSRLPELPPEEPIHDTHRDDADREDRRQGQKTAG